MGRKKQPRIYEVSVGQMLKSKGIHSLLDLRGLWNIGRTEGIISFKSYSTWVQKFWGRNGKRMDDKQKKEVFDVLLLFMRRIEETKIENEIF